MLFRVRQAVAGLLMAASAVWLGSGLLGWWHPDHELKGLWAVFAVVVVGTVGFAQGAWWGRMVPFAWSASVSLVTVMAVVSGADLAGWFLAGGLLLMGCVAGRQMFERYEGQAPAPLDWRQPGMGLVRIALVANLHAFLVAVTIVPMLRFTQSCIFEGFDTSPLMAVCLAMTAILLVGVVLLARQRTAGLLLVAVSAVGLPLVLLTRRSHGESPLILALLLAPGILCGWLALGRFLPGMVRLLRR
jgi:hypothetical protein